MMTVLSIDVPNQGVANYLDSLVGKIYKVLPMKESNAAYLQQYIEWKLREILSFQKFITVVGSDPEFMELILIMYSIADAGNTVEIVRHDVFEAIRLCKVLSARYRTEEVADHA